MARKEQTQARFGDKVLGKSSRQIGVATSKRTSLKTKRFKKCEYGNAFSVSARIQAEREHLFWAISIVECCKYASSTLMEVESQEYMTGVFDALCDILNSSAAELGCVADDYRALGEKR